MTPKPLLAASLATALAYVLFVATGGTSAGCNGSPIPAASSVPDAARSDASDGGLADADPPDAFEPTPPRPAHVPDGWNLWNGYRKACQIYLPSRASVLPAPAQWEPCEYDFRSGDAGAPEGCEQWAKVEPGQTRVGVGQYVSTVNRDGKLLVHQVRVRETNNTWVLVDAITGAPEQSLFVAAPKVCGAFPKPPSRTGSVYEIVEGSTSRTRAAFFAPNEVGAATFSFVSQDAATEAASYTIGETLATELRIGIVRQGPWSNPRATVLWYEEGNGSAPYPRFYRNDDLYFFGELGGRRTFHVAHPGKPIDLWFDNNADNSRSVLAVGTDGTDVAWTLAEGCGTSGCTRGTLYTAKHPAPGERPVGRRLRSESPYADYDVVGCGYVASRTVYKDYRTTLRVTRLTDGTSYGLSNDAYPGLDILRPVGVTCDHVYFTISPAGPLRFNLVRMRLDRLGPAIAPD